MAKKKATVTLVSIGSASSLMRMHLKEVRGMYNLNQREVATALGCTRSNIAKLDGKPVRLDHLVAIAESRGHSVIITIFDFKKKAKGAA